MFCSDDLQGPFVHLRPSAQTWRWATSSDSLYCHPDFAWTRWPLSSYRWCSCHPWRWPVSQIYRSLGSYCRPPTFAGASRWSLGSTMTASLGPFLKLELELENFLDKSLFFSARQETRKRFFTVTYCSRRDLSRFLSFFLSFLLPPFILHPRSPSLPHFDYPSRSALDIHKERFARSEIPRCFN